MNEPVAATMSATTHTIVVRRHPIRGILWGLMMGVGLTVVLVVTKVISFDLTMMIVIMAIALLVAVLWSTVGPARAPQGPPPATVTASTSPIVSRFDDFGTEPAAETSTSRIRVDDDSVGGGTKTDETVNEAGADIERPHDV